MYRFPPITLQTMALMLTFIQYVQMSLAEHEIPKRALLLQAEIVEPKAFSALSAENTRRG